MPREVFGKKDLFTPVTEKEVETPKQQNVKTLKRLNTKTIKLQKVKALKRQSTKTPKPQGVKTLKYSDAKTPKLLRKTIYFTEELWEWIRKEAYEKSKDYSEVVQEAVKGLLENQTENE